MIGGFCRAQQRIPLLPASSGSGFRVQSQTDASVSSTVPATNTEAYPRLNRSVDLARPFSSGLLVRLLTDRRPWRWSGSLWKQCSHATDCPLQVSMKSRRIPVLSSTSPIGVVSFHIASFIGLSEKGYSEWK